MKSPDCTERFVEIGVIGRPHGVRGEVRCFLHNTKSVLLHQIDRVILKSDHEQTHQLEYVRQASKHAIVAFKDITTREDADKIKGAKVFILREQLPPPASDEFYIIDLLGLEAWDGEVLLGEVASSRPQSDDIEIVTVSNSEMEMEVPLVDAFLVKIDFEAGRLELFDTELLPRTAKKTTPK